ncbi:MAG: hypothetical protein DWI57_16395 [Chloroflexi bacterium]|nr:MAG: hypothetical protein DWI57_16395 [Chloroflexota bacterium]
MPERTSPILDRPETFDYDDIAPDARFLRANPDVRYFSDRNSDLHDLDFSRQNRPYARSITLSIAAPIYTSQGISAESMEDVLPLAARFYPGYQETIYGAEGVIISKRTYAPMGSNEDRSVLWQLECQAEGDRLLQIAVEIDWGEPLEQRMVDGLLVAQSLPGQARGVHEQQNAESTRVFGAADGQPDRVSFPDESRAHLLYHVLVAGQVDLPLILTVSEVGEQMAWNGFLAQRDIDRAFNLTQNVWQRITQRGRLWTPDPAFNRAADQAKQTAARQLIRLRGGDAPADGLLASVPALVEAFDLYEPARSRSLLEHLRRLAEKGNGQLPPAFAPFYVESRSDTAPALARSSRAYLTSLAAHLRRQPHGFSLAEHYPAVRLCAEVLIRARRELDEQPAALADFAAALQAAAQLARHSDDGVNEARWEGEAEFVIGDWEAGTGDWEERLPSLQSPLPSPQWTDQSLRLARAWSDDWGWWALVDLPVGEGGVTLVWDGETLHVARTSGPSGKAETTAPLAVEFAGPVQRHSRLLVLGAGEDDFDLRFRGDGGWVFRPQFLDF